MLLAARSAIAAAALLSRLSPQIRHIRTGSGANQQRGDRGVTSESGRSSLVQPPSDVETWIVHTRACEQKLGTNPWPSITIGRLDELGGPLHGTDPETLIARMTGKTLGLPHPRQWLHSIASRSRRRSRSVRISKRWAACPRRPVHRVRLAQRALHPDLITDLNEKSRRSRVASYHLARFLQTAPAGSRICLMGQSDGGRIVLTTMHLLSGAGLPAFWSEPEVQLSSGRPDLQLRAVILDTAAGHHWLNPGERLDQALPTCESLLNLRNSGDLVLAVYTFGVYTGLRPAMGRWDCWRAT